METREVSEPLEDIPADALVFFSLQDEPAPRGRLGYADWILCGALSRLRARGKYLGERDSCALLYPDKKMRAERVLVIGLGSRAELNLTAFYRLSYQTAQTILNLHCTAVGLELPFRAFPQLPPDRLQRSFLEGFLAELARGRPHASFTISLLPPDRTG